MTVLLGLFTKNSKTALGFLNVHPSVVLLPFGIRDFQLESAGKLHLAQVSVQIPCEIKVFPSLEYILPIQSSLWRRTLHKTNGFPSVSILFCVSFFSAGKIVLHIDKYFLVHPHHQNLVWAVLLPTLKRDLCQHLTGVKSDHLQAVSNLWISTNLLVCVHS